MPEAVFKPRRTMTLLLGFIEAVTFYHQYQREVKKDQNGTLYIETTASDIEQAFTLLKEVLFSKSDELTRATREFFERLKCYLQENQLTSFKAQDIRRVFRMEPRTIQRYMRELVQYGQLKRIYGVKGRSGFEYGLSDGDGYQTLQTQIQRHLDAILDQIRSVNVTA